MIPDATNPDMPASRSRNDGNPRESCRDEAESLVRLIADMARVMASDPRRALELSIEAEALAERLGDQAQLIHVLTTRGLAMIWLSDLDGARSLANQLRARASGADPVQRAKAAYLRGSVAQSDGDELGALELMLEGLRALAGTQSTNIPTASALHVGAGNVLVRLSDHAGAIEHYTRGLAIRQQLADSPADQIAVIYNNIGMAHREVREYVEATDAFQRALGIVGNDESVVLRTVVLGNLGLVLTESGRAREAIALLEDALKLCRSCDYIRGIGTMHHNLALAGHRVGDLEGASSHFISSLEVRRRGGDVQDLAETRIAYAALLNEQGRDDEAMAQLEGLAEGPAAPEWLRLRAEVQLLLFRIHRARGEFERALECHVAHHELSRTFVDDRARHRQQALAARYRTEQLIRERDRSRMQERVRLTQDMHDGFGSQLASALVLAEYGDLTQEDLAQTLRECIGDLHLLIDVLGKENTLLADTMADFRFRVGRRLEVLPVRLIWRIDLDAAPLMPQATILQVMRIVQEALNNALRHSKPQHIWVDAGASQNEGLLIRVTDDGSGIGEEARQGHGLANMRKRASELGADLEITARNPGTIVTLRITAIAPLENH